MVIVEREQVKICRFSYLFTQKPYKKHFTSVFTPERFTLERSMFNCLGA